jgi:hypothetical protein
MSTYDEDIRPRRSYGRVAILALVGAVIGLGGGFVFGRLVKAAGTAASLGWGDLGSLAIAAMLGLGGLSLFAFTFTRGGARYVIDPYGLEPGRDPRPAQVSYMRLQCVVLALAGLMLAIPVGSRLLAPTASDIHPQALFLAIAALFVVQTGLNVIVWRRSDELLRRATSDGAAASFWLLQGALFLWAAGEKLRLLPTLNSWDAVTILMGVYLVMSVGVAYRRGLH